MKQRSLKVTGSIRPKGRTKQIEILLSTFQRNINLGSYMAVFVGMYLIYNAVSIAVVHRRKEIGILRALGTSRGEIIKLFLGETFVLAVIGSGSRCCIRRASGKIAGRDLRPGGIRGLHAHVGQRNQRQLEQPLRGVS